MLRSGFSLFRSNLAAFSNTPRALGLLSLQSKQSDDHLAWPFGELSIRGARQSAPTKKRRKTFPFAWLPQKDTSTSFPTNLTEENKQFLDDFVADRYGANSSPLKLESFERGTYQPGSIRTGLIARKIGQQPMWTKTGRRILTTALQIVDNHVVSYTPNAEYVLQRRPFYDHHHFKHLDVMVVGAESADPRTFTAAYRGLFEKAGLPPKRKLTRFFITPNAKLAPGTPLLAPHFRVGDYVNVWGMTRDYGFQGVIKRWKFKGQPKNHGVTKAHRRPGSIARGRKVMGPWKGKKMPGHMGCERRTVPGLKIWRINTKYNVIWVQGPAVPGANNAWCYIYDTSIRDKAYSEDNPPPFPTYLQDDNEELPENIYDQELHPFDAPSLLFEETEEEKKAALAALKMSKKAKIAKIR